MIRTLLDRYFEGQTTLKEEALLREAFREERLPEDLQAYQPLFTYFRKAQAPELGAAFDERLLQEVSGSTAKVRTLNVRYWAIRVAAAIALALGVFWLYQPASPAAAEYAAVDWSKYEVQDPEQAFQITSSALRRASVELNQGTDVAARGFEQNLKEISRFFD